MNVVFFLSYVEIRSLHVSRALGLFITSVQGELPVISWYHSTMAPPQQLIDSCGISITSLHAARLFEHVLLLVRDGVTAVLAVMGEVVLNRGAADMLLHDRGRNTGSIKRYTTFRVSNTERNQNQVVKKDLRSARSSSCVGGLVDTRVKLVQSLVLVDGAGAVRLAVDGASLVGDRSTVSSIVSGLDATGGSVGVVSVVSVVCGGGGAGVVLGTLGGVLALLRAQHVLSLIHESRHDDGV